MGIDSHKPGQADTPPEVEITPAMLAAGADILIRERVDLMDGWANPWDVAAQIYRAMQAERDEPA